MELAEELAARNCELDLQWIRRDLNQLADDLTNEEFKHFATDFRIPVKGEKLEWRILGLLLGHAGSYYKELSVRKRERPTPVQGRRKRPRRLDPW